MNRVEFPKIIALSTEIGRGHPNYLDSVITVLKTENPNLTVEYHNIFEVTSGISRLCWQVIKKFYLIGGSGGIVTKLYNFLRQKSAIPSPIFLKLLGSGLDNFLKGFSGIVLIEHPLVARILANRNIPVFYIHGEIAAPKECAIPGKVITFVPLDWTKERLIALGVKPELIVVTGLLIEPELLKEAKKNFDLRLARLNSNQPLTIAFFISQAYPKEHITKIIAAVESIAEKGMKTIVFTGTSQNKAIEFQHQIESIIERNPQICSENIKVVMSKSRQEENQRTAELMSQIDVMVAAAHERTNWAVGVGLPMFVLYPLIGTYARPNFEFALNQGVSNPLKTIGDAKTLGDKLIRMHKNNTLIKMVQRGFSEYSLDGVQLTTRYLINKT
ncbi:MAG: hypothetical protein OEZ20_01120 [candidate division WOR-3 bacterium]|nr:hypothetical protein [candidate division WOR-3 bacterium]